MKRLFLLIILGAQLLPAAGQWSGRRKSISGSVNDGQSQVLPVFSAGADTLFFSESTPSGTYSIRFSTRSDTGAWTAKRPAAWLMPAASGGNKFVFGQTEKATLVNGHFGRGLQSVLQGAGLAFARPQGAQTNFLPLPFSGADTMYNSRLTTAFFYEPGKVLFLSLRRYGSEDLMVVEAVNPQEPDPAKLQWGSPQKLSVNTPFNETAPWLSPDGGTLYFASDRPGGVGGTDIWQATRGGAWTEWSALRNLGAPVNSKGNETSFTIDPRSGDAVFASDSGTLGGSDIFLLRPDTNAAPPAAVPVPPDTPVVGRDRYKPSNIVFLLDLSNSMRQSRRMTLLKTAMRPLVSALRPVDRVSLYRFGDRTERLFDVPSVDKPARLQHIVDSLRVQGEATNGSVAIQEGYGEALRKLLPAGNNQIFLVTDGDFAIYASVERLILSTLNVQLTVVMIDESPEGRRLLAKFRRFPNVQIVTLNDVQKDAEALLRNVQGNSGRK